MAIRRDHAGVRHRVAVAQRGGVRTCAVFGPSEAKWAF
jgi:hypothetical protein